MFSLQFGYSNEKLDEVFLVVGRVPMSQTASCFEGVVKSKQVFLLVARISV